MCKLWTDKRIHTSVVELIIAPADVSLFLFFYLFKVCLFVCVCLSPQADATHGRVVKREDGERLAKVNQLKMACAYYL